MENVFVRIKVAVTVVFSAVVSWLGVLALPLGLLVLCNVADYATGLIAAPKRGHARSSDRGITGIIKKVCSWLLVGVGMVVDAMLHYLTNTMGWAIPFDFVVGTTVCLWLLANELLSIIENISDITGGNVPPFLKPIVAWVKKQAEEKGKLADTTATVKK